MSYEFVNISTETWSRSALINLLWLSQHTNIVQSDKSNGKDMLIVSSFCFNYCVNFLAVLFFTLTQMIFLNNFYSRFVKLTTKVFPDLVFMLIFNWLSIRWLSNSLYSYFFQIYLTGDFCEHIDWICPKKEFLFRYFLQNSSGWKEKWRMFCSILSSSVLFYLHFPPLFS